VSEFLSWPGSTETLQLRFHCACKEANAISSTLMACNVPLAAAAGRELFFTSFKGTGIRFFSCVRSHMLLQCTLLVPSLSTTFISTDKWFLACVNSRVDDQVGRSKKGFSTSFKSANVWFGALVVSPTMINQISLWSEVSSTLDNRTPERTMVPFNTFGFFFLSLVEVFFRQTR